MRSRNIIQEMFILKAGPLKNKNNSFHEINFKGTSEILRMEEFSVSAYLQGELIIRDDCYFKSGWNESSLSVALKIFLEKGRDPVAVLSGLDGHFAIVIVDELEKKLFVATDPLGIHRIYYSACQSPNGERKYIISDDIFSFAKYHSSLDLHGVACYLSFYTTWGPSTLLSGVNMLRGGEFLEFRAISQGGEVMLLRKKYLDGVPARTFELTDEEAEKQISTTLRKIIASFKKGKKEAVSFSGGLDSSILALELVMAGKKPGAVQAGFRNEPAFCELEYGKYAASKIGIPYEYHDLSSLEPAATVRDVLKISGEPSLGTGGIITYALANIIKNRYDVVYSGQGADELMGGYARYPWSDFWRSLFREIFYRIFHQKSRAASHFIQRRYSGHLIRNISLLFVSPGKRYLEHMNPVKSWVGRNILSGDLLIPFLKMVEREFETIYNESDGKPVDKIMAFERKTFLRAIVGTEYRLRNSAGLRSIFPYATLSFAGLASSIPAEKKIRGFMTKSILKSAYREHLGSRIVDRPKTGFPVPVNKWLEGKLGELVRDTMNSSIARSLGFSTGNGLTDCLMENGKIMYTGTDSYGCLLHLLFSMKIF